MNPFYTTGKAFVVFGVILLLLGLLLLLFGKNGIGIPRLPGDIFFKKDNLFFYFPLTSCIIISIVLSVILNLFFRR
ncbi:MAG: DUF2905 domain-containing protein [Bacillota bacterium]|nr:DUF2905 domain-containing protein [Bacillota bacterium]